MRVTVLYILLLLAGCSNHNSIKPNAIESEDLLFFIDSLRAESSKAYLESKQLIEEDEYIAEAMQIAHRYNYNRVVFDIYNDLAQRYSTKSNNAKAIELFQKALTIADKLDNDSLRAKATHYIAVNFRRINENAKALKYHTKALELAESVNDTFLIHCSHNGIGNVYFNYEDYTRAIESFHQSLNFVGKIKPNILGKAINANLLGESWLFLGNKDSALIYMQMSFDANQQINSEQGKAICYNGMGLIYFEFENYSKAISEFENAIQIFDSLDAQFYLSMALNGLGSSYAALNNYERAENIFMKTFNIANKIGGKRFALEASNKLAKLFNETGNFEQSYKYSQLALAYKDSITEELQRQNTEAMNVMYKAEKQEREIIDLQHKAEITRIKYVRQQYIMVSGIMLVIVVLVIIFLVFRQRRLQSKINEIGLEQKLLRAQLNPHFVFNSLGAVQNFIMKSNKEAASEYLVNFSRLMRNILMGSGEDFILLEDEIEILDDYLKLQRLRFQNKFDYFFKISDDIDVESTLVPPMIVQPFIENSLEHGVKGIDRQGIINIRFIKDNDKLLIEVEDNGNGIQGQKETAKKKNHISMATKITQQRMHNLQSITKEKCSFEVIDNKKLNGTFGVLVRIAIPLQIDD